MTTPPPPSREVPNLAVLVRRLTEMGAHVIDADSAEIADAIVNHALEGAICAGAMVNGKWRALRFQDYYECVFGLQLDGKPVRVAKKRRVA